MLFGEAKVIHKLMNKYEKKFYACDLKGVKKARIVKKFSALSTKFEMLMKRPGITY